MKLNFLTTSFLCLLFMLSTDSVMACSCGARPNVLDAYEGSDVVLVGRIISVEKVNPEIQAERYLPDGVRSATLLVEKVYKGNVRVREELIFTQGGGANCIWTFKESYIGLQVLFYLRLPENQSNLWIASECGRSRGLSGATEDLLYLDNMKKLRGKTRVSGQYGYWQDPDFDVANKKILIRGEKKTYETKTDANGVFEIYDLPPGTYSLEPEIQKGWKIAQHWLRYVADIREEQTSTKSIKFILQKKKHASIDVSFEPDNSVEGSIVGPSGNPMHDVCAYLWTPERTEGFGPHDCTNAKGEFRIESVPAGTYVLVVAPYGTSSRNNFPRLFYPGVTQREKAALISISDGEVVRGINLVIPKLVETVTVSGVVQFSDELPVANSSIQFKATPVEGVDGDVSVRTDAEGRFTFRVVKGLKGDVFSNFFAAAGLYENCPKLDALLQGRGLQVATIKTIPVQIEATQDIDNLVLRFAFPKCKLKPR